VAEYLFGHRLNIIAGFYYIIFSVQEPPLWSIGTYGNASETACWLLLFRNIPYWWFFLCPKEAEYYPDYIHSTGCVADVIGFAEGFLVDVEPVQLVTNKLITKIIMIAIRRLLATPNLPSPMGVVFLSAFF
jgi:hypothetical protein